MFSRKKIVILFVIAVILLLFLFTFIFKSTNVNGYKIKRYDALNGVTATGVVTSREVIDFAPEVNGKIIERLYNEGQFVKKDQKLAVINHGVAEGELQQAQGFLTSNYYNLLDLQTDPRKQNLEIAKEQLIQEEKNIKIAKDRIIKAEAKLNDALLEKNKFETLYKQGAISLRDYEKSQFEVVDSTEELNIAKVELERSKSNYEELNQNYLLVKDGVKQEKILSAKGQLEASKGRVKSSEIILDSHYVRAPFDGYVVEKILSVGEIAFTNKPMLKMLKLDDIYVKVQVQEFDIANVKEGQDAIIVFDAYSDKAVKGKVSKIIRTVDNVTGTFEVKVNIIPQKDVNILPGMTSDVTIITDKVKNAQIVPRKYLKEENGNTYIYIFKSGKADKKQVTFVPFDNNRVLIRTKLEENSIILHDENDKIKDGSRVKIKTYDRLGNISGRVK